jgi:hypothetical protein
MNGWSVMVCGVGVVLLVALLAAAGVAYDAPRLVTAASFTSSGAQASLVPEV